MRATRPSRKENFGDIVANGEREKHRLMQEQKTRRKEKGKKKDTCEENGSKIQK